MVDLSEDCREALPRLPLLPESLALGDSLKASFQPGQILDGASCISWNGMVVGGGGAGHEQ